MNKTEKQFYSFSLRCISLQNAFEEAMTIAARHHVYPDKFLDESEEDLIAITKRTKGTNLPDELVTYCVEKVLKDFETAFITIRKNLGLIQESS